jgi:hypothetical protein
MKKMNGLAAMRRALGVTVLSVLLVPGVLAGPVMLAQQKPTNAEVG